MPERIKAKAKLRVKMFRIFIFEAKLRFALLGSLRPTIYIENKEDN